MGQIFLSKNANIYLLPQVRATFKNKSYLKPQNRNYCFKQSIKNIRIKKNINIRINFIVWSCEMKKALQHSFKFFELYIVLKLTLDTHSVSYI